VGELNHRYFLLFLLANSVFFYYGSYVVFLVLVSDVYRLNLFQSVFLDPTTGQQHRATWLMVLNYIAYRNLELVSLFIFAFIMGVAVTLFLAYHLYLLACGATTNETYKLETFRSIHKDMVMAYKRYKIHESNGVDNCSGDDRKKSAHDDGGVDETADDGGGVDETADDGGGVDETADDDGGGVDEAADDDDDGVDETADDDGEVDETADDDGEVDETAHDDGGVDETAHDDDGELDETAHDDGGGVDETADNDDVVGDETADDDGLRDETATILDSDPQLSSATIDDLSVGCLTRSPAAAISPTVTLRPVEMHPIRAFCEEHDRMPHLLSTHPGPFPRNIYCTGFWASLW